MSNQAATCLAFASCWLLACHMVFIGERPAETGTTTADSETVTIAPETSTTLGLHSSGGQTSGSGTANLETSTDFANTSSSPQSSSEASGTTATESASTMDLPMPDCGNGEQEMGEQCDPGEKGVDSEFCDADCTEVTCDDAHTNIPAGETCVFNDPNDPDCRNDCTKCGDGKINGPTGAEDCDSEPDCDPVSCHPLCGNGKVEGNEECDKASLNGTEAGFCSSTCKRSGVVAFVSDEVYTGDLGGPDEILGLCNELAAKQFSLAAGKIFAPWLSYSGVLGDSSPSKWTTCQIPEKSRPVYLIDETTLVAKEFPPSGDLQAPILKDQFGQTPTKDLRTWTGTDSKGELADPEKDCGSWTNAFGMGVYGDSTKQGSEWSKAGSSYNCSNKARIYCFEQPSNPCTQ